MTQAKTRRGEVRDYVMEIIETSRGPGPCILWPYGLRRNGYGCMWLNGRTITVVRFIMIAIDGPDRPDWQVAHQPGVCHTQSCVRPAHLRWATRAENQQDRRIDGTADRRVLTMDDAAEIRSRYAAGGVTQAQLGREFGVSASMVCFIVQGRYHREKAS